MRFVYSLTFIFFLSALQSCGRSAVFSGSSPHQNSDDAHRANNEPPIEATPGELLGRATPTPGQLLGRDTPTPTPQSRIARVLEIETKHSTLKVPTKLVLIVDNSNSMKDKQEKLKAGFKKAMSVFKGISLEIYLYSTTLTSNGPLAGEKGTVDFQYAIKPKSNHATQYVQQMPKNFIEEATAEMLKKLNPPLTPDGKPVRFREDMSPSEFEAASNSLLASISAVGTSGSPTESGIGSLVQILGINDFAGTPIFKKGDRAAFLILSDEDDDVASSYRSGQRKISITSELSDLFSKSKSYSYSPLTRTAYAPCNPEIETCEGRFYDVSFDYTFNSSASKSLRVDLKRECGSYKRLESGGVECNEITTYAAVFDCLLYPSEYCNMVSWNGSGGACSSALLAAVSSFEHTANNNNLAFTTCSVALTNVPTIEVPKTMQYFNQANLGGDAQINYCTNPVTYVGKTFPNLIELTKESNKTSTVFFNQKNFMCSYKFLKKIPDGATTFPMGAGLETTYLGTPEFGASGASALIKMFHAMALDTFGSSNYFLSTIANEDKINKTFGCQMNEFESFGVQYLSAVTKTLGTPATLSAVCAPDYGPALKELQDFIVLMELSYKFELKDGEYLSGVSINRPGHPAIPLQSGVMYTVTNGQIKLRENILKVDDKIELSFSVLK